MSPISVRPRMYHHETIMEASGDVVERVSGVLDRRILRPHVLQQIVHERGRGRPMIRGNVLVRSSQCSGPREVLGYRVACAASIVSRSAFASEFLNPEMTIGAEPPELSIWTVEKKSPRLIRTDAMCAKWISSSLPPMSAPFEYRIPVGSSVTDGRKNHWPENRLAV